MGLPESWVNGIQQWAASNSSIREVWLFGSRARGNQEDDADVDLALRLMPPRVCPAAFPLTGRWSTSLTKKSEERGRRNLNGLWVARLTLNSCALKSPFHGRLSGGEMAEPDFAAITKELSMLFDEGKYEAFLRRQSLAGDHSFLLTAIKRSNLRPSVRKVIEDLITGKLRRSKHRPKSEDVHIKGLRRALRVLDIEGEQREERGRRNRDSAILEATTELHLSYSTIEKAVSKYEGLIEGFRTTNPEVLDCIRTAFK
jgi:predicted nucleotidyltransferase